MSIVDEAAFTDAGGHVVGTTGDGRESIGEIEVGKGRVRIVGGALPTPSEEFDHRYGLRDYAPTYTGLYLLENSIEHDHPDLGNLPPRLGTRLALTGASQGDYTDDATLQAQLQDVQGRALEDAVVTFDLVGGDTLDFHAEQQPNRESRVTLSDTRDALGMPQLLVDWRHAPGDVQTVQTALAVLARDLRARGVGRLDYDPDAVESEMLRYGAYGGHHIGTARMGSDPRRSVVDGTGRVHGMHNLYVAGAAVFPTSSQANPTLTIVALSLRLADHLRARLAPPVEAIPGRAREAA